MCIWGHRTTFFSVPSSWLHLSPVLSVVLRAELAEAGRGAGSWPGEGQREAARLRLAARAAERAESSRCQPFAETRGIQHKSWRAKGHLKPLSCLNRSKCRREPASCCSPTAGEETMPSLCLLFPRTKRGWCARYPLQTREESALLLLPACSFILLLHQLAASDGQVSLVRGRQPAPPGRAACCWQCVGRRALLQVRAAP